MLNTFIKYIDILINDNILSLFDEYKKTLMKCQLYFEPIKIKIICFMGVAL